MTHHPIIPIAPIAPPFSPFYRFAVQSFLPHIVLQLRGHTIRHEPYVPRATHAMHLPHRSHFIDHIRPSQTPHKRAARSFFAFKQLIQSTKKTVPLTLKSTFFQAYIANARASSAKISQYPIFLQVFRPNNSFKVS